MKDKTKQIIRKKGVFSLRELSEFGLSQQDVSRLVAKNHLTRIGRGMYSHPNASLGTESDFHLAALKFGRDSAIGGLSALFHYNLCEQVPSEVWVVVPPEKRTSVLGYRLMRTKTPLDRGIVNEKQFRIVSVERAVLESLKFITKIGERTVLKAARVAIASGQTTELKIARAARDLGLEEVWKKYIEVIAV